MDVGPGLCGVWTSEDALFRHWMNNIGCCTEECERSRRKHVQRRARQPGHQSPFTSDLPPTTAFGVDTPQKIALHLLTEWRGAHHRLATRWPLLGGGCSLEGGGVKPCA